MANHWMYFPFESTFLMYSSIGLKDRITKCCLTLVLWVIVSLLCYAEGQFCLTLSMSTGIELIHLMNEKIDAVINRIKDDF